MLKWVVDRARQAKRLDLVTVATTTQSADDQIASRCWEWGIPCFRGSESDVLGRFAGAAEAFSADVVVRINADNPLIDPEYLDYVAAAAGAGDFDYISFCCADGRPVMLSALSFFAEAATRDCLDRADREIVDPFQREHVTLGIYTQPERFRLRWLPVPEECDDSRLRLTIDTRADFDMLQRVVDFFGTAAVTVRAADVVRAVKDRHEWLEAMTSQNAAQPKTVFPTPQTQGAFHAADLP